MPSHPRLPLATHGICPEPPCAPVSAPAAKWMSWAKCPQVLQTASAKFFPLPKLESIRHNLPAVLDVDAPLWVPLDLPALQVVGGIFSLCGFRDDSRTRCL